MGITRRATATGAIVAALLVAGSFAPAPARAATSTTTAPGGKAPARAAGPQGEVLTVGRQRLRRECAPATPKRATCNSLAPVDGTGQATPATAGPTGWGALDIAAAYNANTSGGTGVTIAVIEAYSDANIESDLAVYRSQ